MRNLLKFAEWLNENQQIEDWSEGDDIEIIDNNKNEIITTFTILDNLKDEINLLLGFRVEEIGYPVPRVNLGPCGLFAKLFYESWNLRVKNKDQGFENKVHICFIMSRLINTKGEKDCYHVVIRLPSGELFDGGSGIHYGANGKTSEIYSSKPHEWDHVIDDMLEYDEKLLDKWSYRLYRKEGYESCLEWAKEKVCVIINSHLDEISKIPK